MSGVVASIGTTHPWNAAGLGLDIEVAHELGVRPLTVVAAVSAQDATGMHALEPVSSEMLRAQLDALPIEHIDALRVGVLASEAAIRIVAEFIRRYSTVPAVVDPAFGATLGGEFLDESALQTFKSEILFAPSVILTPNIDEAQRLLETADIATHLETAVKNLCEHGLYAVLLKGGHLAGDPIDVLAYRDNGNIVTERWANSRLPAGMRGTGCVLAMSLACFLAGSKPLPEAVTLARDFVRTKIANAHEYASLHLAY